MNTAQSSMPALAAPFYPTQGRATGVAWMLGIGRFGGIAGSFLVAELSARQLGFSEIFARNGHHGKDLAETQLARRHRGHQPRAPDAPAPRHARPLHQPTAPPQPAT